MAIDDWNKRSDGSLVVSHLLGWEAIVAPADGAVRLQTASTPAEAKARESFDLQIALDAKQLRDLGQAFLDMAEKLEKAQADAQN